MALLRRAHVILAVTVAIILATIGLDWHRIWRLVSGSDGGYSQMHATQSPGDASLGSFDRLLENTEGQAEFRERVIRVQTERQQRLAKGCRVLAAQRSNRTRSKLEVIVSQVVNVPSPLQLTYCAIPKCGTTTWFHFFEVTTNRECKRGGVHNCANVKFDRPSSIEDFQPRSLVIVRHPWRRLVSAYVDKFLTERHKVARSCYRRYGKSLHNKEPITFAEFVKCILKEHRNGQVLNAHYAPQHWQCSLCKANYSYIAKMETLAYDFRYLATFVFSQQNYTNYHKLFSTGYRRPNEVRNVTSIVYEDFYRSLEPSDMTALVSLYRPDAVLFGYPHQPQS